MKETRFKDIFVSEDGFVYKKYLNDDKKKLSHWKDNVGYYQVIFRVGGKRKYIRVHRLVAETFIPNPNNFPMVNHKDGNKLNNRVDNLEWCTNSYNTQQAYNSGLYKSTYRCGVLAKNKLTGELKEFVSIRSCAESLNINRKTLTGILKGSKVNNYQHDFSYI